MSRMYCHFRMELSVVVNDNSVSPKSVILFNYLKKGFSQQSSSKRKMRLESHEKTHYNVDYNFSKRHEGRIFSVQALWMLQPSPFQDQLVTLKWKATNVACVMRSETTSN